MQRALLITIVALLPVATAACSESCAQSRSGRTPTGTGTHYPTAGTGGLGGTQTQTPNLSGSLQGTRTPQLRSDLAGSTSTAVAAATSTNVIVKPPPPPPEEPPEADDGGGDENDSGNAITCN